MSFFRWLRWKARERTGELGAKAWRQADDELEDTKQRQEQFEERVSELEASVEALRRTRRRQGRSI